MENSSHNKPENSDDAYYIAIYRSIFLKAKDGIEKKIALLKNEDEIEKYLGITLKNEVLESEKEIREEFEKIECKMCGKCCRFAMSEFSPETLEFKANHGDVSAKDFTKTFTPYKKEEIPKEFLNFVNEESFCYYCDKVENKDGRYFCPIYNERPNICKNYPDTPLEKLPDGCAYQKWKDENEIKALFIRALNEIRLYYLEKMPKQGRGLKF